MEQQPAEKRSWKKRVGVVAFVVGVVLVALAICLPSIVAKSPLRNAMLTRAVDDPDVVVSASAASFGWFSPVSLNEMKFARDDQSLTIDVGRVETERSLVGLLVSLPTVGTIKTDRPRIGLVLRDLAKTEAPRANTESRPGGPASTHVRPTLTAVVQNGALAVRTAPSDEPVIDLKNLSLVLRVQQAGSGQELVIDPVVLLDRQTLTPALCAHGLQLVAPVLADATSVEGNVSLDLREFRIPLDQPDRSKREKQLTISGSLQLHEVRAALKSPLLVQIADVVSAVVGKSAPSSIRVLDNSRVDFDVRDGRAYHQGLAFVIPQVSEELVIRTSGTVGVDESLDIDIVADFPAQMAANIPVIRRLTQAPLRLHVAGTLDHPKLSLAHGHDVLDELADRIRPSEEPRQEKTFSGAISDLVEGLTPKDDHDVNLESTASDILELIRSARGEKKRKKEEQRKAEQETLPGTQSDNN